jgi:hypothetical protein
MSDSWSDLWAGTLKPAAEENVLRRSLGDLDRVLESQPHAYDDIVAIVEKTLSLPWDEGTIATINDSLAMYLQGDAGQIFMWVVYSRAERLQQLSKLDSKLALDLIRRISTSFGRQLQRATQISNGWRDDWDWISLSVAYDQGSSSYRLKFDLTKVTGERFRVESPPDSLMALTTYLLGMLRDVGAKEAFSESNRTAFASRIEEVQKVLRGAPAVSGEDAPAPVKAQP